jgi:predicted chitinase
LAATASCGPGEIDNTSLATGTGGSLGGSSNQGAAGAGSAGATSTVGSAGTPSGGGGGGNLAGAGGSSPVLDAGFDGTGGARDAGRDADPVPATGFSEIITRDMFETMFPKQIAFYDYAGLVQETLQYPDFANTADLDHRKREAAAFLANVGHETIDLVYIEEIQKGPYCTGQTGDCSCAPGKEYFGRGPLQISWNSNYCTAGRALNLPLLTDPDLVGRDAGVAWRTALWFWMTQTGAGTMSGHAAMTTDAGFGETIRTINGSIECGGGGPTQVGDRVNYYQRFTQMLGVTVGPGRVDC